MTPKQYLVATQSGRWWVTTPDERQGPFVSQQVATEAAIRQAKLDFKAGQHARVTLTDDAETASVVYDSTS